MSKRILILTYTTANQTELRRRISTSAGDHANIDVSGWFTFLIDNFVRPFLPFVFRGQRVSGFDYNSAPQRYKNVNDWGRYFNSDDEVRKVHLPQLATRIEEASNGAGLRRLARIYDEIHIDEVQDLSGYDLEVLKLLLLSEIPIWMVGDIRQAILATNPQEKKNGKYMYTGIWSWFREAEAAGRLTISQRTQTWRCRPEIAALADSLFDESWGFQPTESLNHTLSGHDGVVLLTPENVEPYVARYRPLILRYSAASARSFAHLDPMTFGDSKGRGCDRVLVLPTAPIEALLRKGTPLSASQAARFYVAVTRAEQSVAIVLADPGRSTFPYWEMPQHPARS